MNIRRYVVTLGALAACGGTSPQAPDAMDAGSTAQPSSNAGQTLTFKTGSFNVPSGDSFECFYTAVTTDRELSVNSAIGKQGPGGHHVTVYYADAKQPVGHHPCDDAEMALWHQVAAASGDGKKGGAEGALDLPDGYAVKIPAGKQLVTQSHYINSGSAFEADDEVTINLLDPAKVTAYANTFVVNTDQFAVPPVGPLTFTRTCTVKQDLNLLLLIGHMHEFGSHYKLERLGKDTAETLYETDWDPAYTSHPPVNRYAPSAPLTLPAGTRLRQTCSWKNTTADTLKFPREMCIGFGYYVPDQGDMLFCEVDPAVSQ